MADKDSTISHRQQEMRMTASVFLLKVTPKMIDAGVAVLVEEFGGPLANPTTNFAQTAQAVFESMLAFCEPEDLVYRPQQKDD
jgi:hypothetical protein